MRFGTEHCPSSVAGEVFHIILSLVFQPRGPAWSNQDQKEPLELPALQSPLLTHTGPPPLLILAPYPLDTSREALT